MSLKITIQGYEGSFHQIATQQFFGKDTQVQPCDTFRQVVHAVQDGTVDGGMMAIENSIAGSILPNYNLLQKSGLVIVGEVYLQVRQHLMTNPGVTLEDIKEVHSHPMALQQCMDYLVQHHWKLVETEDSSKCQKASSASQQACRCYSFFPCSRNVRSGNSGSWRTHGKI